MKFFIKNLIVSKPIRTIEAATNIPNNPIIMPAIIANPSLVIRPTASKDIAIVGIAFAKMIGNVKTIENNNELKPIIDFPNLVEKKFILGLNRYSIFWKYGIVFKIIFSNDSNFIDFFFIKLGNQGILVPIINCIEKKMIGIPVIVDNPGIGKIFGIAKIIINNPKPSLDKLFTISSKDIFSLSLSAIKLYNSSDIFKLFWLIFSI